MDGDNIFIARSDKPSPTQITKAIKSNLNPKFINVYFAGRGRKCWNRSIK